MPRQANARRDVPAATPIQCTVTGNAFEHYTSDPHEFVWAQAAIDPLNMWNGASRVAIKANGYYETHVIITMEIAGTFDVQITIYRDRAGVDTALSGRTIIGLAFPNTSAFSIQATSADHFETGDQIYVVLDHTSAVSLTADTSAGCIFELLPM